MDAEGFTSRTDRSSGFQHRSQTRSQRPMVMGVRKPTRFKPAISEIRIFATKFDPDEPASDIHSYLSDEMGIDCTVERITSRTQRYASFLITTKKKFEQVILDPNTWEEGIYVRHFYGRLRTTEDQNPSNKT